MNANRHSLDEDSTARLLQGTVHPDDAPPGYGSVAALLAAAASRPALDEEAGAATITAMVEAIRSSAPVSEAPQRRSMIGKIFAGKAAVAAAFAVIGLTATGAAAATGSLPDPVQGVVSDAVGRVGVYIPRPNHGKSAGHRQDADRGQDGKRDGSGDQGQPGTDGADNHGQQTSDAAHDAKAGVDKENGEKVGPAVCAAVGSQCGKGHPAGSDDESGDDQGKSGDGQGKSADGQGKSADGQGKSADDQGKSADDQGKSGKGHGKSGEEQPSTPTTGSIATGAGNSGRDLPSGKGKPGSDE